MIDMAARVEEWSRTVAANLLAAGLYEHRDIAPIPWAALVKVEVERALRSIAREAAEKALVEARAREERLRGALERMLGDAVASRRKWASMDEARAALSHGKEGA